MTLDARRRRLDGRRGGCRVRVVALAVLVAVAACTRPAVEAGPPSGGPLRIHMDRSFEVLEVDAPGDARRARLALAAHELGDWQIHLAGQRIDAERLARIAATPESEPLVRAAREELRRAVDVEDLLLLLDDVLVAGRAGHRGEPVWITPGRGRRAGVLVHPDEVYEGAIRRYGAKPGWLEVSPPRPQASYPPARDGEPLGPRWTMRFRNPSEEREMLEALRAERPDSRFAERLEALWAQLREAGADVQVNSTVRLRERGYLMWGAYALAHTETEAELDALVEHLDRRRRQWGLETVRVRWRHPLGARETRAAALEMAETYDVVYATEAGARDSMHYGGRAADFTATGLPRTLELLAPDGRRRRFDLSDPDETRDLSLTPRLVDWIEEHFEMEKLRGDYPHWGDLRTTRLPEA